VELGKGSPNVLIHDRPAFRCDVDEYGCTKDGAPEIVRDGAARVHINGWFAVRDGDYLLGPAPNLVVEATARVEIGEDHVGLGSRDGQEMFCKEWCAFKAEWPSLDADARQQKWKDMVNRMFDNLGIPRPTEITTTPGNGGVWRDGSWSLEANSDWNAATPDPFLGEVTQHEVRHGEQTWFGLRGAQRSRKPVELDVPPKVLKASKDAPEMSDAEQRFADSMHVANITDEGLGQLSWATEKVDGKDMYHERYPKIPCGADARQLVPNLGKCPW